MNHPVKVLFVCMGNICRSPAAEGIMQEFVRSAGLEEQITCDSAGTIGFHAGSPADKRMSAAANERGYRLNSLSRPVVSDDLYKFDWILTMDEENFRDISHLETFETMGHKVHPMCKFAKNFPDTEVPDPYYGGQRGFVHVMDLLEDACGGLLEAIKEKDLSE